MCVNVLCYFRVITFGVWCIFVSCESWSTAATSAGPQSMTNSSAPHQHVIFEAPPVWLSAARPGERSTWAAVGAALGVGQLRHFASAD